MTLEFEKEKATVRARAREDKNEGKSNWDFILQ